MIDTTVAVKPQSRAENEEQEQMTLFTDMHSVNVEPVEAFELETTLG